MTLPNLQLMIQAGGKLSKTLQQQYAEFACRTHKRFIVMYGQTEATARMSYLRKNTAYPKLAVSVLPYLGEHSYHGKCSHRNF